MIFDLSLFEDGQYIISAHPEDVPAWKAVMIGSPLSKSEGEITLRWLRSAWGNLDTLSKNMNAVEFREQIERQPTEDSPEKSVTLENIRAIREYIADRGTECAPMVFDRYDIENFCKTIEFQYHQIETLQSKIEQLEREATDNALTIESISQ